MLSPMVQFGQLLNIFLSFDTCCSCSRTVKAMCESLCVLRIFHMLLVLYVFGNLFHSHAFDILLEVRCSFCRNLDVASGA